MGVRNGCSGARYGAASPWRRVQVRASDRSPPRTNSDARFRCNKRCVSDRDVCTESLLTSLQIACRIMTCNSKPIWPGAKAGGLHTDIANAFVNMPPTELPWILNTIVRGRLPPTLALVTGSPESPPVSWQHSHVGGAMAVDVDGLPSNEWLDHGGAHVPPLRPRWPSPWQRAPLGSVHRASGQPAGVPSGAVSHGGCKHLNRP